MKNGKERIFAAAFAVLAALLLGLAGLALRPARVNYGAVWGPYRAEPADSLDYLYLGSSYAYCDVNPALVYDASGLTGYVLAGPEQTLSQTYYYLKEALRTQSPQAVILEASALHFARYQSYTQINVGYMPFSRNKLAAIFRASEPELRTGLLFELYFYHDRWKQVSPGDVLDTFAPDRTDLLKGYTAVDGLASGLEDGPFRRPTQEEDLYQENLAWLGKILTLCEQEGILPLVVFHPTYSRFAPQVYTQIAADVAALSPSALCLDRSGDFASAGLDPLTHLYDAGHLNRAGAARFSAWLGVYLTRDAGLTPRPQTAENTAARQLLKNVSQRAPQRAAPPRYL